MEIGIGIPGHAPWTDGRALVEWARRAEARGFSALAVSDRLCWSTPEPLTMLAAAAGATARIRLLTSVVLAPLHANHLLFAKTVATLDHLAGAGRLQLGLAAGFREDDYVRGGVDYVTRGQQFTALLDRLGTAWRDESQPGLRPATADGPALLFGGTSRAALTRIATRGTGWVAGTATPEDVRAVLPRIDLAWSAQQRAGRPRVIASVMWALGPDARAAVSAAIGPYYAFAGRDWVEHGVATALTSPDQITATIAAFERSGCDELIFTGNDPDPDQVDQLADVIGLAP